MKLFYFSYINLLLLLIILGRHHLDAMIHVQILEAREIFEYNSFSDVQFFYADIPEQSYILKWSLKANESFGCQARKLSLFLRHGSFPVINPYNTTFPDGFVYDSYLMHSFHILSDSHEHDYFITNPLPGTWFLGATLLKSSDKIIQKGLVKSCKCMLQCQIKVELEQKIIHIVPEVHSYQDFKLYQHLDKHQLYKFFVPSETWMVSVNISHCSPVSSSFKGFQCPIIMAVSPQALPSLDNEHTLMKNCTINPDKEWCLMEFTPQEDAWHYLSIQTLAVRVEFGLQVEFQACWKYWPKSKYLLISELDAHQLCQKISKDKIPKRVMIHLPYSNEVVNPPPPCLGDRIFLDKIEEQDIFTYKFLLPSNANETSSEYLDLNISHPPLLSFDLDPVVDTGGTLEFKLVFHPLVDVTGYNISVVACLSNLVRAFPSEDNRCPYGYAANINTSTLNNIGDQLLIPFPAPGRWYIAFGVQCYVSMEFPLEAGYHLTHPYPCQVNHTRVQIEVRSASCIHGMCGDFGECFITTSGAYSFSSCNCKVGYRGWGCTDDKFALSHAKLLISTLLLTLSNLLFLPAITVACYRCFYAEALAYFATMFFSTFYHACDEEIFQFCLLRPSVLQFCDFYSAIFSCYLTLACMADLHNKFYLLLSVAGALGLALGVEYDRTGLWVFVIPVAFMFSVLTLSWIYHCKTRKKLFPDKKYWVLGILPGCILAALGFFVYVFLETETNYAYTHSAWHAIMALSILFLLPYHVNPEGKEL